MDNKKRHELANQLVNELKKKDLLEREAIGAGPRQVDR